METYYATSIKEIYQQVSEVEFNRINPYAEMVNMIKGKYPNAKIVKSYTEVGVLGSLQFPILIIKYTI